MEAKRVFRSFVGEEIETILDGSKRGVDIPLELDVRNVQEMDRAFFLMLEMNELDRRVA